MKTIDEKLPIKEKLGYLCSGVSYTFCMMIPAFLIYYATENLVLSIATVSGMMALVKILDGITDLISGVIIDKTKSKFGKARPWFLRAAIPYGLCMVLLFSIPSELGSTAKVILLAVLYALVVSVFGTLIGVARYAIVPRMTTSPRESAQLGVLGDGIGVFVSNIGMAVTLILAAQIGWNGVFTIYGIVATVFALLCFALTQEHTKEISETLEKDKSNRMRAKEFLMAIFKNKYALLLFAVVLLQQMAGGVNIAGGTYYFRYVVGNLAYFNRMAPYNLAFSLIGMVMAGWLVKRIGPKKMFVFGGIAASICYAIIGLLNGTHVAILLPLVGLSSMFGMVFMVANFAAFTAAAVSYGEAKNGIRLEGITSSVLNIGIKIGTAFGTALFGTIVGAAGYQEGGVEQTAETVRAIGGAFVGIPLTTTLLVTILVLFVYRIQKDMAKLDAKENA